MTWQDPEAIRFMLDDCKVWAVVGLSGDTSRTAYSIAALLQERGKQIVPIHPAAASEEGLVVLGEQGYATLADVPFPIDVVDVFRRSDGRRRVRRPGRRRWVRGRCGSSSASSTRRRSTGRWRRGADGDGHLPGHRVAQRR